MAVWAQRTERPVFAGTPRSVSASAIYWNAEPPERIERMSSMTACSVGFSMKSTPSGPRSWPWGTVPTSWIFLDAGCQPTSGK